MYDDPDSLKGPATNFISFQLYEEVLFCLGRKCYVLTTNERVLNAFRGKKERKKKKESKHQMHKNCINTNVETRGAIWDGSVLKLACFGLHENANLTRFNRARVQREIWVRLTLLRKVVNLCVQGDSPPLRFSLFLY